MDPNKFRTYIVSIVDLKTTTTTCTVPNATCVIDTHTKSYICFSYVQLQKQLRELSLD